jgi:hypothetical protein
MAYNNNIPQPNDDLSVSQPQILANYAAIAIGFNLNHVNFNAAGEGKHAFVEMPNQGSAPFTPPVTIANEVGLYCNSSTLTNQPELFFIKQAGTTAPPPLNGVNGYEITSSNYAPAGWTRLPSGILLKWGTFSGTSPFTLIFDVSASNPAFANCYNVQLTSVAVVPQSFTVSSLTNLQCIVTSSTSPAQGYYFAIGV